MDGWVIAGFIAQMLLQVIGFGCVVVISRQGKGEGRQQVQGETIASLRASITAMHENRNNEMTGLRREWTDDRAVLERRVGEVETRLERSAGQVDTLRNSLSKLETIVENLAKTVERWVERDERARSQANNSDAMPDVAMLRAMMQLIRLGGDIGKAPPSRV